MVDRNDKTVKYISSKLRKYSKEDIIYALVRADFTFAERVAHSCELLKITREQDEEERQYLKFRQAVDEYNALSNEAKSVGIANLPHGKIVRMLALYQEIQKLAGVNKK